jgi:hypothetical protein
MSASGAASPDPQQSEIYAAFKRLYDSLNDAYWAASTTEAKDRISGERDEVYLVIMDLVAEDIRSRTAEFQALSAKVAGVNNRLEALSKDIANLVARITTVNAVVADIAQVVSLARAFFP